MKTVVSFGRDEMGEEVSRCETGHGDGRGGGMTCETGGQWRSRRGGRRPGDR